MMNPRKKYFRFRSFMVALLAAGVLTVSFSVRAFASVIGNFSFEDPIGSGTENNWDSTNGAARASNAELNAAGFANAPNGAFGLIVQDAEFTFQLEDVVKEGDFVTFSGFAQSTTVGAANGGRLKIEFKRINDVTGGDQLIDDTNRSSPVNTTSAPAGLGNAYVQFTASGIAPEGTTRVVFTIDTVGGNGGATAWDDINAEINPAKLTVSASQTNVRVSEPVLVRVLYRNKSNTTLANSDLVMDLPPGFDVERNSVRVDGTVPTTREGSFIIPMGTVTSDRLTIVEFILIPTVGLTVGKLYELIFVVNNGNDISDKATLHLNVVGDPVFDEGTIIGKVFHDANRNGTQDGCVFVGTEEGCSSGAEKGVPFVRLFTEEGIMVITDEHGRYHIPAVRSGRHIVKIDGHSLPKGTEFVTEESYLVKTTPGILNKANFAVWLPLDATPAEFKDDLMVSITQGLDTSRPTLEVFMAPDIVETGLGRLSQKTAFRFAMNYPDFVKSWFLEIRDELGQLVWSGFGVGAPPSEVEWEGQTEAGLLIKPGVYSYQLKVQDNKGREDWTVLKFFRVLKSGESKLSSAELVELPAVGDFNLFKDGKRAIPLVAKPTVRIQGKTRPQNSVTINGRPAEVSPETGNFHTELYVNPGKKEYLVESTDAQGNTVSYRKELRVKDSTFFMVALGEEQLGYNFSGAGEAAGREETYKHEFYQDGRLSYYLRGKIRGKFLVKSHYDTDDKGSGLFTNLDPDDYYPIYGDASVIDYEGDGTTGRFYVLVEMDRSFLRWGSFKTAFTDTELATYERTLGGLKIHQETLGSTVYGDPLRGLDLFWTKAEHRADHNEFLATGGSLYYLRNREVIEGSEKIRVEVRDKIQGITVESRDLTEGMDYEIDYRDGRILLSRPLSSVAASDTIVSADPLDGNPVYLVVDYEFRADPNAVEHQNRGLRGYTHVGDHVRVGGTAVEEQRVGGDYELRGVDATMKFGRNTKIFAEYAESQLQQTFEFVSYNGGLSFGELGNLKGKHTRPREFAYLVKAESKPFEKLEVSGFVQDVEPGFSTGHSRSQQGMKKVGMATRFKFNDNAYARYRFDHLEVTDQLLPLFEHGVRAPFNRQRSHTAQLVYDDGLYLGHLEYLHRTHDFPIANLQPTLESEFKFQDALAAKIGYRLNERLLPYTRGQVTWQDKKSYQFGGGVQYEISKQLFAHFEQIFSNLGDSSLIGFEKQHDDGARSYSNIRLRQEGALPKSLATTVGSSYSLTEKSRVYSESEYSLYDSVDGYADILGYQGKLGDHWDYDLRYERRHLDNSITRLLDIEADQSLTHTNTFNTASGSLAYADGDKLRARTYLEYRRDQDEPRIWQAVTRNSLEYHLNPDLQFLGKLDYGKSRFLEPDDTAADFMEFSTGFAYRPIDNDKLNMLSRYTYLRNLGNDFQYTSSVYGGADIEEAAHILSMDLAYEIHPLIGLVEKVAYKRSFLQGSLAERALLHTFLWANRFNFHVTRKWDIAAEYRILFQKDAAHTLRHGALFEVDREVYDYVRLGAGYNFAGFDDDLRKSQSYDTHGPFVRLTGKF